MLPPSSAGISIGNAERSGVEQPTANPVSYICDGVSGGYAYPRPQQSRAQPNSGAVLPEELVQESDLLLMEMQQQSSARDTFERRMEHKLNQLECENAMLKRMFVESHNKNAAMQERMDRVLKTIYNIFVAGSSGGNANMIAAAAAAGGSGLTIPLKSPVSAGCLRLGPDNVIFCLR
jgi:hypothetical protein